MKIHPPTYKGGDRRRPYAFPKRKKEKNEERIVSRFLMRIGDKSFGNAFAKPTLDVHSYARRLLSQKSHHLFPPLGGFALRSKPMENALRAFLL